MDIKPIRTAKDHQWALREIEGLWDKAKPGTAEGDRFEVLSALVDAYEQQHFEIPAPDPIEAIRCVWSKKASRTTTSCRSSRHALAYRR